VRHKNTPNFLKLNLKKGYPILIIFGTHISDTTGHQMAAQFPTSLNILHLLLHYVGKTEQTKYALKSTKNLIKFYLFGHVAINSQSITRFDFCAAARLLNRPNIQEYL